MSPRVRWGLVAGAAIVVVAAAVSDPGEMWGIVGLPAALVGVAAVLVFGEMSLRASSAGMSPRAACPACGYRRGGLGAGAVCPECGRGAEDAAAARDAARDRALLIAAVVGAAGLMAALFILFPGHGAASAVCAALGAPMFAVARRRWFGPRAAMALAGAMFAAYAGGVIQAMWEATHSTDGLAAVGFVAAPIAGWVYAGVAQLVAGAAIWRRGKRR